MNSTVGNLLLVDDSELRVKLVLRLLAARFRGVPSVSPDYMAKVSE